MAVPDHDCVELDGPPVAYFYDGSTRVAYIKVAFAIQYPGTADELIRFWAAGLARVRQRSKILLWRKRPCLDVHDGRVDGPFVTEEAYSARKARLVITARLACYPPLADGELESLFAVEGDGNNCALEVGVSPWR